MSVSETYAGNIQVITGGDKYSFKASGTLNEGRLVELNTDVTDVITVEQASENSKTVLGYVGADWEAGDYAVVYTGGVSRLEDSGSAIAIGARVASAADGKIKTFPSGSEAAIAGVALEAISASEFGKVFVNICYND